MPLTDVAVRNAKPGSKTLRIRDERGLYLEISPKGGKWWRFRYMLKGRANMLSLGVYPDVSLKEARHRRDEARRLLANGIDPGKARRKETAEVAATSEPFEITAREFWTNLETGPLELTSIQRQVIDILSTAKSKKYSLSDWYLGAIYAAKNTYNPDRYSQAAQSLRELLEKLPRVFVESEIQESMPPKCRDSRDKLYLRLCSYRKRCEGGLEGNTIDFDLDKTIQDVERYLDPKQTPTRGDHIRFLMNKLDPMYDIFDKCIKLEKSERFMAAWKYFENLAHHKNITDENIFWQQLSLVEHLIIDILAQFTAEDHGAIRAIISRPHLELDDVVKMFELIKRRGANYAFFFKMVDNPDWISPLAANGFFKNPLNVEDAEDGHISAPLWWPILYLQRVSPKAPEQVVEIILGLEETNNPRILREIFLIACDLSDIELSLRLKPLIQRFLKSPYRWGEEELIVTILQKWGRDQGPSRIAAREIVQYIITFQPDPKQKEKRVRREENPEARNTALEPLPRFDQWEYQHILENGVRPLAECEPYQAARILIEAVACMIKLGMHPEDFDNGSDEDYSEIWCPRLDKPDHDDQDVKAALVQTLTYACEQVYEKDTKSIDALDQALRNHRWKVFKRLRQHLYSLNPNDQTLPWIREQILGHADYHKFELHNEFQLMIRKACEHFGQILIRDDQRKGILDAIFSGPSKDDFREWMGDRYSEEDFQKRQRNFHHMQLRPFSALLKGKYRRYFNELEVDAQGEIITDDTYLPFGRVESGYVSYRSPKSYGELEGFTDEELLTYLNDWNDVHHDKDNMFVEINYSALASVFQSLFKERIVSDGERLTFWMTNRYRIARPIYVTAMLKAMQELVKDKIFGNLNNWIEFCLWVLSHPDPERIEGQPEPREESHLHPNWESSRRAVVDFIDTCVNKDTNAPITARDGLVSLLQKVCNQPDWRLDHGHPMLLDREEPITEAINNTRSRAIESLVNFGFWTRRHAPEDSVPEVTDILSIRISENAKHILTRPERALLGMHFGNLCSLNQGWAIEQRSVLFPRDKIPVWRDAFCSYIRFNRPSKVIFEILQGEFEYALENLEVMTGASNNGRELADKLGQFFFINYLWKVYPLTGDGSLLECFYVKTNGERKRWAQLFSHVGRTLRNSGKHLEKELTDRIVDYVDWRLEAAEPLELQEFTCWLEAECLSSEWRLRSYSKTLDLVPGEDRKLFQGVKALNKLLPDHLEMVVECFAKITDAIRQSIKMYIPAEDAKSILRAGLKAEDLLVRKNASRALNNLLSRGFSEYHDLE